MKKNEKFGVEYKIKKVAKYSSINKITSSLDVANYSRHIHGDTIGICEKFFAIYLDNNNRILGYYLAGQGGRSSCSFDVQAIYLLAIKSLCTSVIINHNHPSGKLIPSQSDDKTTKTIKNGLELLGIKLLDHVIVTENQYYSYADQGNI